MVVEDVAFSLIDLLWRDHPAAPRRGSRGPRARVSTGAVVDTAIRLADKHGLDAMTIRQLAAETDLSTMSIYTHVNTRDDLLVLMADTAHARIDLPAYGRAGWRTRVERVAVANLALLRAHPWLLDITDDRTALGPGTIAKYDHELRAFRPLALNEVTCDAALTFVLDFVRASVAAERPSAHAGELADNWPEWGRRLADYVGDDYPTARAVGAAAGAAMDGVRDHASAWQFGLARVLDGLANLAKT